MPLFIVLPVVLVCNSIGLISGPETFYPLGITWILPGFCGVRVAQYVVVFVLLWEKLSFLLFFTFPFQILPWVTRSLTDVGLELLTLPVQPSSRTILIKSVLLIFIFLCLFTLTIVCRYLFLHFLAVSVIFKMKAVCTNFHFDIGTFQQNLHSNYCNTITVSRKFETY